LRHPQPPAYGPSTDTPGLGVPVLSPKAVAPQLIATAPSMVTVALEQQVAALGQQSPGPLQEPLKAGKEPSNLNVEQQCIPLSIWNSKLPELSVDCSGCASDAHAYWL